MTVEFIIPGKPQGKERPRLSKNHTYTPAKTKNYEEAVGWIYKAHNFPELKGALKVTINAFFGIPKSTPKKYLENLKSENVFYTKKSDADNIGKAILDSLSGIAYKDDNQVSILLITKKYSDNPRAEVTIEELEDI